MLKRIKKRKVSGSKKDSGKDYDMKKIAIVTGASSGMGKEFAQQMDVLLEHTDEIWVIARRTGKLLELEKQMLHRVVVCPADLTKKEDLEDIRKLLKEEKPRISVLVNAAGFGVHGRIEDVSEERLLGMLDLNCRSLTALTKICLPYMAKGGRIINLASAAAFVPQPKFAVYAAGKSYVLSFSKALNAELDSRQISVTAVCPGPVDTEFFTHDDCDISKTFYKRLVMAKPENVVKQALKDAMQRKELSFYGNGIKAFYVLTKLVPHKLILAIMKLVL